MVMDNETICLSDMEPSNVKLYEWNFIETVGTIFAIGIIALTGLMISMLFNHVLHTLQGQSTH